MQGGFLGLYNIAHNGLQAPVLPHTGGGHMAIFISSSYVCFPMLGLKASTTMPGFQLFFFFFFNYGFLFLFF